MKCPSCKDIDLTPTKLDFGLPALLCNSCEGIHLDLLTYRSWLEDVAEDIKDQQAQNDSSDVIEEIANTDHALICTRCSKFMRKYDINSNHDNTINVCHTCDDVWLDNGEWELLKKLNIQDKLTYVMSAPWQNKIQEEDKENAFNEHYQNMLGDDFDKVADFVSWLNDHPKKSQIKHFMLSKNG